MGKERTAIANPEIVAEPDSETLTEWTVMGYMAGDNNLNEEMVLTLQEMLAHGVWDRVKILAQLDPSGLGLPTQRYIFDTPNHPLKERRYLKTYFQEPPAAGDFDVTENTGNPAALSGLVKWTMEQSHASDLYHMLILAGHGSGSTEDFLMKDTHPVDSLTIEELRTALETANDLLETGNPGLPAEHKRINLLGMDCCFMSMVEVFYQIRNEVDFVVGAESMVPDFGWPYHRILDKAEELRWTPGHGVVTPQELAEIIVKEYIEYYSDYDRTAGRSVDLAAIRLVVEDPQNPNSTVNLMESLASSIKVLALALLKVISNQAFREQIHLAHLEAQTYKFDQFVDLLDLCVRIRERFENLDLLLPGQPKVGKVISACIGVEAELTKCVVLSGCSGFAYQHSHGMSIYFPWAKVNDDYIDLAFAKPSITSWEKFLREYVKETRRDPRPGPPDMVSSELDTEDGGLRTAIDAAITVLGDSFAGSSQKKKDKATGLLKKTAGLAVLEFSGVAPGGSRYNRSRYNRSRYNRSRWPGDREKSVKNFTPVVGTAYWPAKPEDLEDSDPD